MREGRKQEMIPAKWTIDERICLIGSASMRAAGKSAEWGQEAADVYGGILAYRGKYMV